MKEILQSKVIWKLSYIPDSGRFCIIGWHISCIGHLQSIRRRGPGKGEKDGIGRTGAGFSGMGTGVFSGSVSYEAVFQVAAWREWDDYGLWDSLAAHMYARFPGNDGTVGI